jgi:hypothetical protein
MEGTYPTKFIKVQNVQKSFDFFQKPLDYVKTVQFIKQSSSNFTVPHMGRLGSCTLQLMWSSNSDLKISQE